MKNYYIITDKSALQTLGEHAFRYDCAEITTGTDVVWIASAEFRDQGLKSRLENHSVYTSGIIDCLGKRHRGNKIKGQHFSILGKHFGKLTAQHTVDDAIDVIADQCGEFMRGDA